jgi:hypothetical protein
MRRTRLLLFPLLLLAGTSCADRDTPTDLTVRSNTGAPSFTFNVDELKTVTYGGESLTFWPFTGGSPSRFNPVDPMNLIFVGDNDPRAIRAALLFLDGNNPVFGCAWTDAIGDVQTAYTDAGAGRRTPFSCSVARTTRFVSICGSLMWGTGHWVVATSRCWSRALRITGF